MSFVVAISLETGKWDRSESTAETDMENVEDGFLRVKKDGAPESSQ